MEYFYKVLAYEGKCYIGLSLSGLDVSYGFEKETITDEDSKVYKKIEGFLNEADKKNVNFCYTHDLPWSFMAEAFLNWVRETHPEFKFEAVFVGDEEARQRWFKEVDNAQPKLGEQEIMINGVMYKIELTKPILY